MVASKHEALRLQLVHLVRDNGNELTSEEGNLVPELALALNTDTKLISDIVYKLRQRGVLFFDRKPGGKTYGVFLEDGWEERMESEYRKLPHMRPRVERVEEEDEHEEVSEPVEEVPSYVRTVGMDDDEYDVEEEEDDIAEQIRLGQAMVLAAAQAMAKVDEAERIVDRFTELAQQHIDLDAAVKRAKELDRRNLQLEDRLKELSIQVERLATDNRRLSDELKKRHTGNSVAERLSPGERQAMTRLMRELKQKGGGR